jgi:hypothetical protein
MTNQWRSKVVLTMKRKNILVWCIASALSRCVPRSCSLRAYLDLQALKTLLNHTINPTLGCSTMVVSVDIVDAERHIKIFLSAFETFDHAMRGPKEKPTWITSYNFMCLMNIPTMLWNFGPVKNLWEGGGQGEKIIGLLKPLWFGFRKNWHLNLMNNLLKWMAIDRVQCAYKNISEEPNSCTQDIEEDADSVDAAEDCSLNLSRKMVQKYSNLENVQAQFESRKPSSLMCLKSRTFAWILRDKTLVELNCETYNESFGKLLPQMVN